MDEKSRIFASYVADLHEGQILRVEPDGTDAIALYRIGDDYFATDDTCTHGDASLSDGEIVEEYEVECPYHGGRFCIKSGEPTCAPCIIPLKTHKVVVEEDKIFVCLD